MKPMTQMQQAFSNAQIEPRMFRKFKGHVLPNTFKKPLVIETHTRTDGNGHRMGARPHVQHVSHITGYGRHRRAVTEGGDVWPFVDEGNNFLREA